MRVHSKSIRELRVFAMVAVALITAAAGRHVFAAGSVDPLTAARFALVIDGTEIATFTELQGLTSEVEVAEYSATSDKEVVLKRLPGKAKPPSVTLKGWYDDTPTLWAWHVAARSQGLTVARQSCALVMFGADGKPVARYHLEGAWPSKIEIAGLKAGATERLQQTVTLVAEAIQRVAI